MFINCAYDKNTKDITIATIILDIMKLFDTVSHSILSGKLQH